MAPSTFNTEGYFEDEDIVQFHEEMLASCHANWHDYKALKNLKVLEDYKLKAIDIVKLKYAGRALWGWKDPRTVLFLDFWQSILPEARYVFVFRKPSEVVWSLLRRGDLKSYSSDTVMQALEALRLWIHYNYRIIDFVRRNLDKSLLLFVPYDLNVHVERLVNQVVRNQWMLEIRSISLIDVYKPDLLRRKMPWWIERLTNLHFLSLIVLRELKALRSELLARYPTHSSVWHTYNGRERGHGVKDSRYSICVMSPNRNAYSETFIHAHIERLPARVRLLYGGWFPAFTEDNRLLISHSLLHRVGHGLVCKILGLQTEWFRKRALQRYLKRGQIKAVLAEYGPTGVKVMDACRESGVPLIVHFHGFDAYDYQTLRTYGKEYPRLFKIAAAIIVVSRDMERQLLESGAPRERLYYNPYGVDTSLFSGADPAATLPTFVAVGRFVDKKAPHLTLLAFKKVVDVCPEARLIMIGDGELWEACKQLAKALKIASSVEFPGVRSHVEVAYMMRQARAFVQHSVKASYGDSEGTPVTVLEAGATGLPVVSTRHGGIIDVVIDGETGFLVEEGDIESMAEHMLRLARDPRLAGKMGRAARERVCTEFSMEKSIGNLWQIIESAIKGHRKG